MAAPKNDKSYRYPFRLIRGAAGDYEVRTYKTEAARDKDAQHFANLDNESVIIEERSLPWDSLNEGWGMVGEIHPEPLPRS